MEKTQVRKGNNCGERFRINLTFISNFEICMMIVKPNICILIRGALVDSLFLVLFSEKKWVGRSEKKEEKEKEKVF